MASMKLKHCDFRVRYGDSDRICDKLIPNNASTELGVEPFTYSVDLCDEHKARLLDALEPYLEIARKGRGAFTKLDDRGRKILRSRGGGTFTQKDIRAWLVSQGELGPDSTGRIPNAVVERFLSIH